MAGKMIFKRSSNLALTHYQRTHDPMTVYDCAHIYPSFQTQTQINTYEQLIIIFNISIQNNNVCDALPETRRWGLWGQVSWAAI